eukprot:jgi/Undpi1/5229/HiC_scaffold_2.g00511.m1
MVMHLLLTSPWHCRQTTGPCGAEEDDLLSWEVSYDGSSENSEDDPPTAGNSGRVQLNLYVCCPFGEYEIDLDVESYSDEGSTLQQRTAWEIENGPDECDSSIPSGAQYQGCFVDDRGDRLLDTDKLVLMEQGPDGMTGEICSAYCADYEYFGLEFGSECFCGTGEELESAVSSDQCGLTFESLCTGDATTACGGRNSISVYNRTGDVALSPSPPSPTPAPVVVEAPMAVPTPSVGGYTLAGCYADSKSNRIMENKTVESEMSAEICFVLCNDGINTHFGTQYSTECWCAVNVDLTTNGGELALEECDSLCAGTTSDEYCGGNDKITAYEIESVEGEPKYIGCYGDATASAMDGEEIYAESSAMTNELCIAYCAEKGHAYAGTTNSEECWCGDAGYDIDGKISDSLCSNACTGDETQACGGHSALSVYSTS